jgi:T5orf172 domain
MRAYVYVFPVRDEQILKLGMSRDPFVRLRGFHTRYYHFFDLANGYVIHAVDKNDAFRIERTLGKLLTLHNAAEPLEVDHSAGGHTEWYRGAASTLRAAADEIVREGGYASISPSDDWIKSRLIADATMLYEWTNAMLDGIDAFPNSTQGEMLRQTLIDALDAYTFFKIPISPHVTLEVAQWYAIQRADSGFAL